MLPPHPPSCSQWPRRLMHWSLVAISITFLTWNLSFIGWMFGFIFLLFYVYMTWHYHLFSSQGIPGPRPIFPLGCILPYLWKGLEETEKDQARRYGDVYGTFVGRRPMLVVQDLNMVQEITVTRFADFTNRPNIFARDKMASRIMLFAKDEEWRKIRHQLSGLFGSSRCKKVMETILSCTDDLVQNIDKSVDSHAGINFTELLGLYCMDVVLSTCFGVNGSIQARKLNKYVHMGGRIIDFSILHLASTLLGKGFFGADVVDFFADFVNEGNLLHKSTTQTYPSRPKTDPDTSSGHHTDLKKDCFFNRGLSREELQIQVMQMMIGGYDSMIKCLNFIFYHLATNPHCQQRLHSEIVTNLPTTKEPLTYQQMNELEYLHMCVLESLRLYPPAMRLEREARTGMQIDGIHIPKGCMIDIPVIAIHHHPLIYPEPHLFRPERFERRAHAERHRMAHIPFGAGPRSCIGMHLSMLETKMAVVQVIRHYRLYTCDKTDVPMKLKPMAMAVPANGIWLRVERRN